MFHYLINQLVTNYQVHKYEAVALQSKTHNGVKRLEHPNMNREDGVVLTLHI